MPGTVLTSFTFTRFLNVHNDRTTILILHMRKLRQGEVR